MKGLKHAALAVHDLERAQKFYEAIGFKPYHCTDKDWIMLRYRETTLSLVKVPTSEKIKVTTSGQHHPAHLGFLASNREEVEKLHSLLKDRKDIQVAQIHEHRDKSYGFYFSDTEGNNLEFIFIPTVPVYENLQNKEVVLLWVHGSQKKEWAAPFEKLIEKLNHEDSRRLWVLAHLEGQGPRISAVLKEIFSNESIRTLKVIPIFISTGAHISEDLKEALDSIKALYPDLDIRVSETLMESHFFIDALLEHCLMKAEEMSS